MFGSIAFCMPFNLIMTIPTPVDLIAISTMFPCVLAFSTAYLFIFLASVEQLLNAQISLPDYLLFNHITTLRKREKRTKN